VSGDDKTALNHFPAGAEFLQNRQGLTGQPLQRLPRKARSRAVKAASQVGYWSMC